MDFGVAYDSRSTRFFLVFGLSTLAACEVLFADPSRMRFPASLARLTVNAYTWSRFTSVGAIFLVFRCMQAASTQLPSQGPPTLPRKKKKFPAVSSQSRTSLGS